MNRSWSFRFADRSERDEMEQVIKDLIEAGHRVAVALRSPPGVLIVRGDKEGVTAAALARPARSWR